MLVNVLLVRRKRKKNRKQIESKGNTGKKRFINYLLCPSEKKYTIKLTRIFNFWFPQKEF